MGRGLKKAAIYGLGFLVLLMGVKISLALHAVSAPSTSLEGPLRVGVLEESPPYDFYDERNQLVGLNLDIIREMARRDGRPVEIKVMPYNRIVMGLLFKHYDVIVAPQSVNPYRGRIVHFLSPYHQAGDVIVYHRNQKAVNTLDELGQRHLRVGVFNGTSYPTLLKKMKLQKHMVVYPTQREMVMAFLNGKVDVMLMDEQIARYYRDQEQFPFRLSAGCIRRNKAMAFSVRNEDKALASRLNGILDDMQRDGTLSRIKQTWDVQ